jgi:hypothetical protein
MMKETGRAAPPEGFRYQADVVPPGEERELVGRIRELPLKEPEFHGYVGKRRVHPRPPRTPIRRELGAHVEKRFWCVLCSRPALPIQSRCHYLGFAPSPSP